MIKKIVIFLAAVIAAALTAFYFYAGTIIKKGIEAYGPDILGVPVHAGFAGLSPLSGEAVIHDLVIGNPPGFKTAHALKLETVRVVLSPKSLFTKHVTIHEVIVAAPDISVEKQKGKLNLEILQANAARYMEEIGPADPSRTLSINHLSLTGAAISVTIPALAIESAPASIGDIAIGNIGTAEKGVTPGEATQRIMKAVMPKVMKAAAAASAKGFIKGVSRGIGRGFKKLFGGKEKE